MVLICGVFQALFWGVLEVVATAWGSPVFGGEGGACRISYSTSNSLYAVRKVPPSALSAQDHA